MSELIGQVRHATGRRWVLSVVALAILTGCRDSANPPNAGESSEGTPLVFSPRSTIDAEFGRIGDVAVSTDGRVFVADVLRKSIECFDSLGRSLGQLGRPGKGPGEFSYIASLAIAGDHLFVLDAALQRVTEFSIGRGVRGVAANGAVETFSVKSASRTAMGGLVVTRDGDVVIQMALPIINYEKVSHAPRLVRVFSETGAVLHDSLMAVPSDEYLVTRSGGGYAASPMPFGKRSILRVGPTGVLYHLWTGDTAISVLSQQGVRTGTVSIKGLRIRTVSPTDLAVMRASIVKDAMPALARILGARFDQAVKDKAIPDTMPSVSDFVVDDRGDVWLTPVTASDQEISTSLGMVFRPTDGETEVWMLDPRTGTERRGRVPLNGRLAAVVGDRAYFVTWDSLDVESLRVFDVATR